MSQPRHSGFPVKFKVRNALGEMFVRVAQLFEHLTENEIVTVSSAIRGSINMA